MNTTFGFLNLGGGGTIFRIVLTPQITGISRLANGDDILTGSASDDVLDGGPGNNILIQD